MKCKMLTVIMLPAALAVGLSACQEDLDFNTAGVDLHQYQLQEAVDIWKGGDVCVVSNYTTDDLPEDIHAVSTPLTLAMSNGNTPSQGVTLSVGVDNELFSQEIADGESANYAGGELLPSQFYSFGSADIAVGSPSSLTIDTQGLVNYVASRRRSGKFLLPISLKSQNVIVNPVLGNMTYVFNVSYGEKYYYIKEAAEAKNVTVGTYFVGASASDYTADLTLTLRAGQWLDQGVSVDLFVDKEALNAAIAAAQAGDSDYSAYLIAEQLPDNCYSLSADKLGASPAKVTIKASELVSYVAQRGASGRFVLPISISSDNELINSEYSTIMYFITVLDVRGDNNPRMQVDSSAAPTTLDNGRTLVWQEEFNGSGVPDAGVWSFESGFARNEEAQWYCDQNAEQRDGALVITAKKERVANPNYNASSSSWKENREYAEYTSSSIVSKFVFNRGTLLVRAKLPCKSGTWPAIWTTGWYSGWPSGAWEWPYGGEIDIMEYYPNHSSGLPSVHANVCWGSNTRWSGQWNSYNCPTTSFNDLDWDFAYHIWRMDWDMEYINLYCDDVLMNSIPLSTTWNGNCNLGGEEWNKGCWRNPFTDTEWNPCYQQLFLNLALGGYNGGAIDEDAMPFEYCVDYVRLYQNTAEDSNEVNKWK